MANPRERETVFWVGIVEVCEIHTNPPFPIGHLDHDDISKPHGVEEFSDEIDS